MIEIADKACQDIGIEKPRVAVAGLNPHCGENGLFGTEEITEITPAIEAARAEGINAIGPLPPDSVFSQALGAGTISWCACTTIRAISPSRPSASYMIVKNRSGKRWRESM